MLAFVVMTLWPSAVAGAQRIEGAEIGVTTPGDLRSTRGRPDRTGRTSDGAHHYYRYAGAAYFFGSDSLLDFVRIWPPNPMTRQLVQQVFGPPVREARRADLSLEVTFSDTVLVSLNPAGDTVQYIEYHRRPHDPLLSAFAVGAFYELIAGSCVSGDLLTIARIQLFADSVITMSPRGAPAVASAQRDARRAVFSRRQLCALADSMVLVSRANRRRR